MQHQGHRGRIRGCTTLGMNLTLRLLLVFSLVWTVWLILVFFYECVERVAPRLSLHEAVSKTVWLFLVSSSTSNGFAEQVSPAWPCMSTMDRLWPHFWVGGELPCRIQNIVAPAGLLLYRFILKVRGAVGAGNLVLLSAQQFVECDTAVSGAMVVLRATRGFLSSGLPRLAVHGSMAHLSPHVGTGRRREADSRADSRQCGSCWFLAIGSPDGGWPQSSGFVVSLSEQQFAGHR